MALSNMRLPVTSIVLALFSGCGQDVGREHSGFHAPLEVVCDPAGSFRVEIMNFGQQATHIDRAAVSCSCLEITEVPDLLQPGETGVISVVPTRTAGPQEVALRIDTDKGARVVRLLRVGVTCSWDRGAVYENIGRQSTWEGVVARLYIDANKREARSLLSTTRVNVQGCQAWRWSELSSVRGRRGRMCADLFMRVVGDATESDLLGVVEVGGQEIRVGFVRQGI